MSILEIELAPEMEQRLAENAKRQGMEAKAYAQTVMQQMLLGEIPQNPKRSIMELEGLGREAGDGVDVQQYINEMRDEWDAPR